jgi:serine phosphatase RsbU (regulator of sigma subunit)
VVAAARRGLRARSGARGRVLPGRRPAGPGDALVLYTDGLVEIPHRDLAVGIDKLLGEAERLVPRGFRGGADLLVRRVAGASSDDRGLVLLWRSV